MIDWLRREDITPEIDLGGRTLPITLRRHRQAKRLTLRIAPDGSEVKITLPAWARDAEALAFAHTKREWLEAQIAKIPSRTEPEPGSSLLFRGESYRIDWDEAAPRTPLLEPSRIRIGGPLHALERRLQSWLELEALSLFEGDVAYYCGVANLKTVPVALSRAQKRWGSCSDKSKIRINWRLVQAPDLVRRSVVAHEVAHLVHFDHSPKFHTLLEGIFEDDIRAADRWLRDHGRGLYASFG